MIRRLASAVVLLSLAIAAVPAPVKAMSTAAEIQLGQEEDQQIVAGSVIETDPLLNAYVQGVAENLWNQVARKDVPYSVKIIKDDSINSFATMGGFVYVNEGLVDFVQSDDELASVLGHETGHIERRHVITTQSKAEILDILFGIASLFSPLIYNFGGLAEAGLMAKISREDELQADRYGLQLMSRAGYDPESMVTMMAHLAVLQDEKSDLLTKVSRGPSRSEESRRASHGISGTGSQGRDDHAAAGASLQRRRARALRVRIDSSRRRAEERPAGRRSAARDGPVGSRARSHEQEPADARPGRATRFGADARRRRPADRRAAANGRCNASR